MEIKYITACAISINVLAATAIEANHLAHGIKAKSHIEVEHHQPISLDRFQHVAVASGSAIDSGAPLVTVRETGSGGIIT